MSRLAGTTLAAILADATAVGRGLGLRVDEPVLLRNSLNVLVWLRPSPVVARVQARIGLVRGSDALADSLALAAWLTAAGLPVAPPVDDVDPGPHVGATGRPMTLWRHLAITEGGPEPADAGRSLARLHEAMAAFRGPLRHVGPLDEIDRLASHLAGRLPVEADRIRSLRSRIAVPQLPTQALHGDAHLGNVVATDRGLVWLDWEESWRGPVAWDLACLDHRRRVLGELHAETEAAFRGYGRHDRDSVEAWAPVVALWAAAWGMVGVAEGVMWGVNARRRLAWLEATLPG